MAVIDIIKTTAEEVGITAVITNSEQNLKTQLNRLKDLADDPMALISWDLTTSLEFDESGFLKNPTTPVVMLLMTKADSTEKEEMEKSSEEMGEYFTRFIIKLRSNLVQFNRGGSSSSLVTGAEFQLVPKYGMGQHSGIIGRFTMSTGLSITC